MPVPAARAAAFLQAVLPDAQERGLVERILAKPNDGAARLVYADWLEERGDLRADFLRLHQQMRDEATAAGEKRLAKLRAKISPEWLAVMGDTVDRFGFLEELVHSSDRDRGYRPFLRVTSNHGLLDVHYSGNLLQDVDDAIDAVLPFLATREVAPVLHSVRFDGHEDRGRSNGTLPIDLRCWLTPRVQFTRLTSLRFEQGSGVILDCSGDYQENGTLAQLLDRCPSLLRLIVPSAPNASFFQRAPHPLQQLDIAVGYDHQDFVLHLGASSCFPKLRRLVIRDYAEDYMDDSPERCIPFAHFQALFQSAMLAHVRTVDLLGVQLSRQQISALRKLRTRGVNIQAY